MKEILVGVDGSPDSWAGLEWATDRAVISGEGLMVVHAVSTSSVGLWLTSRAVREELRALARPIVDDALTVIAQRAPGVPARGRVLLGSPTRILSLLSVGAELAVLGRGGHGALTQLWLGSVAERVLAQAHCPAVAVTPQVGSGSRRVSRVVVGFGTDGNDAGDRGAGGGDDSDSDGGDADAATGDSYALRFGFEEARRRGVSLVAVHVIPSVDLPQQGTTQYLDSTTRRCATSLAAVAVDYPGVPATATVRTGVPSKVLATVCEPGELLVLGRHRRRNIGPARLGGVAAATLHAARCPVAVAGGGRAHVTG